MLNIYKDYYLDADAFQYILGRAATRKRGGVETVEITRPSYHGTIAQALAAILESETRQRIASGEVNSMDELLTAYRATAAEITAPFVSVRESIRKVVLEA